VTDHSPDWITVAHGTQWYGGAAGGGWCFPFGPLFSSF
jgi:hypothetical protein